MPKPIPVTVTKTEAMLASRKATHGEWNQFSDISRALKDIVERHDTNWQLLANGQKESLDMICHKMARILTGDPNHEDHWDDIVGYAQRGCDCTADIAAMHKDMNSFIADTDYDEDEAPPL